MDLITSCLDHILHSNTVSVGPLQSPSPILMSSVPMQDGVSSFSCARHMRFDVFHGHRGATGAPPGGTGDWPGVWGAVDPHAGTCIRVLRTAPLRT